jgi:hypothetical protein
MLVHAVLLLAKADKSRAVDWLEIAAYSDGERREIPDVARDKHTAAGRLMGRGVDHFFDEGTRLEPHVPVAETASRLTTPIGCASRTQPAACWSIGPRSVSPVSSAGCWRSQAMPSSCCRSCSRTSAATVSRTPDAVAADRDP